MKRIIVTPAGRKRYLEILAAHLEKQKSFFDEWHLWQNTEDIDDIKYLSSLSSIKTSIIIPPENDPKLGNINLNKFYKIDSCDKESLYLKLDDDIVWMEPLFIDKMFRAREQNTENLLIVANTINNSLCSHLHMRHGLIPWHNLSSYNIFDSVNWSSPLYAASIHHSFLSDVKNFKRFYFNNWYLFHNERVSINAVSWRGEDFKIFNGIIDGEDEHFLTYHGPSRVMDKPSVIHGNILCSHFSYKTQMLYLDHTDFLAEYKSLIIDYN